MRPSSIVDLIGQEPLKRNLARSLEVMTTKFGGQFTSEIDPRTGRVDVSNRSSWDRSTGVAEGAFKGGAYLISGGSGMGKSTVAEALSSDLATIATVNHWPEFSAVSQVKDRKWWQSQQAGRITEDDRVAAWVDNGPPNK